MAGTTAGGQESRLPIRAARRLLVSKRHRRLDSTCPPRGQVASEKTCVCRLARSSGAKTHGTHRAGSSVEKSEDGDGEAGPSAIKSSTNPVRRGVFRRLRMPYLRSCQKDSIHKDPCRSSVTALAKQSDPTRGGTSRSRQLGCRRRTIPTKTRGRVARLGWPQPPWREGCDMP